MPTTDEAREAGYSAVWRSGALTEDAWANARIWRAVEAALDGRAEWERNRPISDEAVRAAARSLAQDDPGFEDDYLDMARAALEAARGTKQ